MIDSRVWHHCTACRSVGGVSLNPRSNPFAVPDTSATRQAHPFTSPRGHITRAAMQQLHASSFPVAADSPASRVAIERVHCLSDNYVWLLHDHDSGLTAVVDPSEAAPVQKALADKGWKLDYIVNTHHHHDHTGGNLELKAAHGSTIVGPKADKARIPGIDVTVGDGDVWKYGAHKLHVYDTPGHTKGHICFWAPSFKALFSGDTLFILGCGRTFEGTPQQMWASLDKLRQLPDETRVFCGHEYTQSNARWALSVDPSNASLQERKAEIDKLRAEGLSTVPGLLGQEKATNPFLRPEDAAIRSTLNVPATASNWEAFGALRHSKDVFK